MRPPIRPRFTKGCRVAGCNQKHEGRGYCKRHLMREVRKERWEKLIKIKGGFCARCKQSFHFSCFDFHHRDPRTKEIAIGMKIVSNKIETLIAEIKKCDLLCSNCHRIIHFEMYEMKSK